MNIKKTQREIKFIEDGKEIQKPFNYFLDVEIERDLKNNEGEEKEKNYTVRILYDGNVLKSLQDTKSKFTKFYLAYSTRLKHKYALRMYELCKSWQQHFNREKIKGEIREYFGFTFWIERNKKEWFIPESYEYKDIKRNVIDKSLKEINEKTDIFVEIIDTVKKDGVTKGLKFSIIPNPNSVEIYNDMIKERKDFIDKKYKNKKTKEKKVKEDKILQSLEGIEEYINGDKIIQYYDFLGGILNKDYYGNDEEDFEEEQKISLELAKTGEERIKKEGIKIKEFLPIVKFFKEIMNEKITKCYIQNSVLYINENEGKNDLYMRFAYDRFYIQILLEDEEKYKDFLIIIDKIKNKFKVNDVEFSLVKNEFFKEQLKNFGYYIMYPDNKNSDTYTSNKEMIKTSENNI